MSLEEHLQHVRSTPSPDGLRAMAAALERGARVVGARRLGGGIGSATSAVTLRSRTGRVWDVVLKRYPEGDDSVAFEWERLTFARQVDVPSPEPVAEDLAGAWFGTPALVISKLPGRPLLDPPRPDAWMREIACALVAIEAHDLAGVGGALRRPHRVAAWTRPDTSGWGALYARAADAVARLLPGHDADPVLCHADFHPGNMLFRRGSLSGLVDWSSTRVGPRAFDLAYCRVELALLFGGDAPARLARAYEVCGARAPAELPLWDLVCALDARQWSHLWLGPYGEQGRTDLTLRLFRARLQAFAARAIAALMRGREPPGYAQRHAGLGVAMARVFETDRLIARTLSPEDAEAAFVVYGDPDVMRYVTSDGATMPSVDFARAMITNGMLSPQPDPRFGFWGLERRDDKTLIGTVALVEIEDSPGAYELGWHLAKPHWGKGYAFESGLALLRHAFDVAGLEEVFALARPENERSLRACERIGMRPAGTRMSQGLEHRAFVAERPTWRAPTA